MAIIRGTKGNDNLKEFSSQHWTIENGQYLFYLNGNDTISGDDENDRR